MHLRLADSSDVAIIYDIRQAAILQLSLTRLSECEAVAWAACSSIPRVQRAVAQDEVWVASSNAHGVAWIHRAANSIEGLYVSPTVARQGIGASLVRLAEDPSLKRAIMSWSSSPVLTQMEQRYSDGHEIHAGDRVTYDGQRGRVAFVADRDEFEPGYDWHEYASGVMLEFDNGARLLLGAADELLVFESGHA
jgi:hypothetical protein